MQPIKQPLSTIPIPANIIKLTNNNQILNQPNILSHKTRLSCPQKSLNAKDISNQDIIQHIRGYNKIKRISTAGASKRFPKDFFREDRENLSKRQPVLMLKWRKNQLESSRGQQSKKNKYSLNINIQVTDPSNLHTPKFNEPESPQTQNQFLPQKQKCQITPFPCINEIKIESIEQTLRTTKQNFIKKVKKGEYLKQKLDSIRSQTLNKQSEHNFHRVYSVHQTQ